MGSCANIIYKDGETAYKLALVFCMVFVAFAANFDLPCGHI